MIKLKSIILGLLVGSFTILSMYLVSLGSGHRESSIRDLVYIGGEMGLLQTFLLCVANIYLAYTFISTNTFSFLTYIANSMLIATICGIICAVFIFYFVKDIRPDLPQMIIEHNVALAETEEAKKIVQESLKQKYTPLNLIKIAFLESILKGLFIGLFTGGVFGLLSRQFSKRK